MRTCSGEEHPLRSELRWSCSWHSHIIELIQVVLISHRKISRLWPSRPACASPRPSVHQPWQSEIKHDQTPNGCLVTARLDLVLPLDCLLSPKDMFLVADRCMWSTATRSSPGYVTSCCKGYPWGYKCDYLELLSSIAMAQHHKIKSVASTNLRIFWKKKSSCSQV